MTPRYLALLATLLPGLANAFVALPHLAAVRTRSRFAPAPRAAAGGGKGFGSSAEPAPKPKKKKRKSSVPSSGAAPAPAPAAAPAKKAERNLSTDDLFPMLGKTGYDPEEARAALADASTGGANDDAILKKAGMRPVVPEGRRAARKGSAGVLPEPEPEPEEGTGGILDFIPPEAQNSIEQVLTALLTLLGSAFVLGGCVIGVEAYALSTNHPLPPDIDSFIVDGVFPAFTPIGIALLATSSVLGTLKIGQFGRKEFEYSEGGDDDGDGGGRPGF